MKWRKSAVRTMQTGLALGGVTLLFMLTSSQAGKQDEKPCSAVMVSVDRENGMRFLEEDEVEAMLTQFLADSIINKPLRSIPAREIEQVMQDNPYVDAADVYFDAEGVLHVDVFQKRPLVRIINKFGVHYYIDKKANKFPVNNKFTCRVPVVTGNITEGISQSDSLESETLINIYKIISYIDESPLWKAELEQLNVRQDGTLEMVPKLGDHLVVLGGPDRLEEKLEALELFYKEGLNYVGWDKYKKIDLTYLEQIVCTKK